MTDAEHSPEHHDEDVENDAVIGNAFRASLLVFVIPGVTDHRPLDFPEPREGQGSVNRI